MIDCHAHLADERFESDLEAVLQRAEEVGVEAVICVAEGVEDARQVLDLAAERELLRACIGLHPERADRDAAEQMCGWIRDRADELVGIGEVGLDYWLAKEAADRALQREVLGRFVALSNELELPLNVHSRSAGHYTIDFLCELGAQRVLMHAFDGRASYALAGVEAGFFFSVPPSIVRSPQKQKLIRRLPLERLLLETDSPVLGPDRTQRNEPANVAISARAVAELKEVSVQEVVAATTRSARRLFTRL